MNEFTKTPHRWTEEERQIIRRDYKHTRACRRELARRLGVTDFAVAGQISMMGIGKRTDRRPWGREEDERLGQIMHLYAPSVVATMMHRSRNAVVSRAKRLSISRRVRDGWFTETDVCHILGKDHRWVERRIQTGNLKASYHTPGVKPGSKGLAMWHIAENDLKEFICRYPEELTGSNVDLLTIVDILAGVRVPC